MLAAKMFSFFPKMFFLPSVKQRSCFYRHLSSAKAFSLNKPISLISSKRLKNVPNLNSKTNHLTSREFLILTIHLTSVGILKLQLNLVMPYNGFAFLSMSVLVFWVSEYLHRQSNFSDCERSLNLFNT